MKLGTNKNTARLAGMLYLIVVITGIFSLAYVPSKLIVWGDAAKTFQQIAESPTLFRMSIVSSAICYVAFLLLPFVLYCLLRPVNEISAKLMIILAVVSVPVSMLNLQNKYAVLTLINGTSYLQNFDASQIQSQMMLSLENYDRGILIVSVFLGALASSVRLVGLQIRLFAQNFRRSADARMWRLYCQFCRKYDV
jgi:Domain of unknown function (DUF4386)